LPANSHKQLVVIDFEYASANTTGLEFANHFTEWSYNYHDPDHPHAFNEKSFPTIEEQRRFIRAYVMHSPGTKTPNPTSSSASISNFMLDSRTPTSDYPVEETKRDAAVEEEVDRLMKDALLWRAANSAQWVAWGIVQAKVPELDANEEVEKSGPAPVLHSDPLSEEGRAASDAALDKRPEGEKAEALLDGHVLPEEAEDEDEFDYLSYAHQRAMFFWADVLALGVIKKEDLPEEVLKNLKAVNE
jgi:choline kinase